MAQSAYQRQRAIERALITNKALFYLSHAELAELAGVSQPTLRKYNAKLLQERKALIRAAEPVKSRSQISEKTRKLRERIHGAGKLITDKEFQKLTVTQIAKRAKLSRQTLYNHYGVLLAAREVVHKSAHSIDAAKVESARRRILETKVPLAKIAREEGITRRTLYEKIPEAKGTRPMGGDGSATSDDIIVGIKKRVDAGEGNITKLCADAGISHMTYYRRLKNMEKRKSSPPRDPAP